MNRKEKILVGIIIILFIIISILLVFFIKEKQPTNINNNESNATNIQENSQIEDTSIESKLSYYANLTRDNNYKELTPNIEKYLTTDFKNIDFSSNDTKIIANCSKFANEDEFENYGLVEASCFDYQYTVNENIIVPGNSDIGCTENSNIYKYNDYIIITRTGYCVNGLDLKIYDKTGKLVYSNDKGHITFTLNDNEKEIEFVPIINNGILYFINGTISLDDLTDAYIEMPDTLTLNSINLNSNNISENLIVSFKGSYGLLN